MSNAPPGVFDALRNYINTQTGQYPQYPTIPANPNLTMADRFVQPSPEMSLPFRQGGAPPLAKVAALGNPGIAQAFRQAGPGGPSIDQPYQDPPLPPVPGIDRLAIGQNFPGLLG